MIGHDARGQLTRYSALESLPWAYQITWLVQVMPMFFIVGGYANAASLASHRRRRGGDAIRRLLIRLTGILTVLVAVFGRFEMRGPHRPAPPGAAGARTARDRASSCPWPPSPPTLPGCSATNLMLRTGRYLVGSVCLPPAWPPT